MRIISGSAKGKKLKYPKTSEVRPTRDMVKEALFDILGKLIVDAVFLDLFAGVGSIGLEALSRGAAEVVFIEQRAKYIHENIALTGLTGARVYGTKVATALKVIEKNAEQFDIVFLDPPYQGPETEATLLKLSSFDILKPNGMVIVEHLASKTLAQHIGNLELVKFRKYGRTALAFYKKV